MRITWQDTPLQNIQPTVFSFYALLGLVDNSRLHNITLLRLCLMCAYLFVVNRYALIVNTAFFKYIISRYISKTKTKSFICKVICVAISKDTSSILSVWSSHKFPWSHLYNMFWCGDGWCVQMCNCYGQPLVSLSCYYLQLPSMEYRARARVIPATRPKQFLWIQISI